MYTQQSLQQINGLEEDSVQRQVTGSTVPDFTESPEAHDQCSHSHSAPKASPYIMMSDPSLNKVGIIRDDAELSDTEFPNALTGSASISSYFTMNGMKSNIAENAESRRNITENAVISY